MPVLVAGGAFRDRDSLGQTARTSGVASHSCGEADIGSHASAGQMLVARPKSAREARTRKSGRVRACDTCQRRFGPSETGAVDCGRRPRVLAPGLGGAGPYAKVGPVLPLVPSRRFSPASVYPCSRKKPLPGWRQEGCASRACPYANGRARGAAPVLPASRQKKGPVETGPEGE